MEIIELFSSDRHEHWIAQIKKSHWNAGDFLAYLLEEGKLKDTVGKTALVLMLVDEDKLISFCTFAPLDDIQPTSLSPWIGFVYTFPEHRGNRYAGRLLDYGEFLATIMGKDNIYISTNHIGLYEKYGYQFLQVSKDIEGDDTRIYVKYLQGEGKEDRENRGNIYKAQIVKRAKENINPIAYCGFSCNHCFLGDWCGGCRSFFCCCSYGTLFEKGKCPNEVCCIEKNIEGCYMCEDLLDCQKGFYKEDNDGAKACKAQALFIKKYGKEKFLKVHNRLHQKYDFKKTQEILSDDVDKALRILEENIEE